MSLISSQIAQHEQKAKTRHLYAVQHIGNSQLPGWFNELLEHKVLPLLVRVGFDREVARNIFRISAPAWKSMGPITDPKLQLHPALFKDISEIRKGMPVRIHLNGKNPHSRERLETRVSQIDPDVILMNGRAVYRVRCLIGMRQELVPGMTFSASMLLYRTSLASLLTEKLNKYFNPSLAREKPQDK